MSITAENWARKQRCPSAAAKFVLITLGWYANETGDQAFPSIPTLCAETQHDDRTVRKALKALVDAGLVSANERRVGGQRLSTEYRLKIGECPLPKMGAPPPPPKNGMTPPISPTTPPPKNGSRKSRGIGRKKGIAKAIPAAAPPDNVIPIRQPAVVKAQPPAKPKTVRQRFLDAMVPRVQAATGWPTRRCFQILNRAVNDAHGSFITVVQAIERLEEDGEYQPDMVRFFFATLAAKLRAPLPYDENDQVGL